MAIKGWIRILCIAAVSIGPLVPAQASADTVVRSIRTVTGTLPLAFTDLNIAAAGDIACARDFDSTYPETCRQSATAALLATGAYDAIFALGDEQYDVGRLADFNTYYDGAWGGAPTQALKLKTSPTPGNHEYYDPAGPAAAHAYFTYFGAAAGDPSKGYYDFFDTNVSPKWHFIVLNAVCADDSGRPWPPPPIPPPPACDGNSAQVTWLAGVLAANPNMCTLAFWHHPRFSSSPDHTDNPNVSFWPTLYGAKIDIVLNGHAHDYERFAKMNASGAAAADGIAEFIVGTGGEGHGSAITSWRTTSQFRNWTDFGILKLTLHAQSYDWRFLTINGPTLDASTTSQACNRPAP